MLLKANSDGESAPARGWGRNILLLLALESSRTDPADLTERLELEEARLLSPSLCWLTARLVMESTL